MNIHFAESSILKSPTQSSGAGAAGIYYNDSPICINKCIIMYCMCIDKKRDLKKNQYIQVNFNIETIYYIT